MGDKADRSDAKIQAFVDEEVARVRRACEGEPGNGICEDCGEDIPPARLEAWPHARRCVRCQEMRERGL